MDPRFPFLRLPILVVTIALLTSAAPAVPAGPATVTEARTLLLTGRYREAREAYAGIDQGDPLASALGVARCQAAVGEVEGAIATLQAAAAKHADAAALRAELARLEFERGHHAAAQEHVDAALRIDPDQPAARLMAAELHRVAGRLEQADEAYVWFVRFYNREQDRIKDPETMRLVGLAAAQYARWNRNSGQFHFLVNTLYPDAAKLDPLYWPARLEAALLFIEKYNRRDATSELDAAAAINPRSAEVHAARALIALQEFELDSARVSIRRALAINPRFVVAHRLEADLAIIASGPRDAVAALERARAIDPTDEETLGRLAAVQGAIDGLKENPDGTRMGALIAEATGRNARCGEFFAALASGLDLLRKYPYAARYYEEARKRMPQLIGVPGQLGLVEMRLADEAGAQKMLKEAAEIDPFNVRVKNSLAALEVLEGYDTIETEHFRVRFDAARDSMLARYAARFLEEVYPEVVKELGYAPPEKSLFEIFSSAKGTSGHGWFSARMVGLPFLGTVGACAGKMVAMASPNDGAEPFNWARVLKHEFVHIVNLQQTGFNIPHWFTEALAVRHEGPWRPAAWDRLLAERAAAGTLFDLESINMGFARPSTLGDWTLAYCQAELYARYMADTHGDRALAKMIKAYADNLDTPAALKRSFGVSVVDFEKGYRAYIDSYLAKGGGPTATEKRMELPELERAVEKSPGDAGLKARLARAHLEGRPYHARELALAALAIDPKQQRAAFVVARVHLLAGEKTDARAALTAAFDERTLDPEALALLATLALQDKDHVEAERLGRLGQTRFPRAARWDLALASVYRETGRNEELAASLAQVALNDADDVALRMELARLATVRNDFEATERWAREAIYIDVTHADAHAAWASGLTGTGKHARSIEEYDTAIRLEPARLEWRLALARACTAAGQKDRARRVLDELLQRDANFPGARELRDLQ